ncbi:MAG: outer membrane protein insertion porin family [Candidatus Latescibacterota bacterium]|jgi:outer membrane protein insertion porin family
MTLLRIAKTERRPILFTMIYFLLILLWASVASGQSLETGLEHLSGRTIQSIDVQGNRFTREYVIRRELRSAIGSPLDLKVLREDLQRLDNLDIFSSRRMLARTVDDGVALTLDVREIPFAIPYISYDVTDEDGWSFGPALKSVNMLGRDIFVAGYALFGGKTTFLLDLNYPWIAGNHLSFDLDLSRIERLNVLDGFHETSFEFSPSLGLYIGERGRAAAGFSYLRFESIEAGHTLSTDNTDDLFQVGARLGFDERDNWGDPHQGWLNEVELRRTGGFLPGDGDFWTAHFDLRRFHPLGQTHTLVVATLLSLQSGQPGIDIPEYMDFHLGGSNTIRGHSIRELGVDLAGKNQFLGTLEYRFPLLPSREYEILGLASELGLSAAFFADTGMAWNVKSQVDRNRLHSGIGLGLRLLMPAVDMTRLDVGFDAEGNWQIHFASFSKMRSQRSRLR